MEESILHGGEKELLELKKTLQEKNRYNAVLDSMDAAVEEQKEKIEQVKEETVVEKVVEEKKEEVIEETLDNKLESLAKQILKKYKK